VTYFKRKSFKVKADIQFILEVNQ